MVILNVKCNQRKLVFKCAAPNSPNHLTVLNALTDENDNRSMSVWTLMNISPLLRIQKYKVSLTSLGINSNIFSSLTMRSSLQFHNVLEMCMEIEEQAEMKENPQMNTNALFNLT